MVNTIFILNEKKVTKKVLTIDGKFTFYDDLYTMDLSTGVESYEFTTNVTDIDENCYVMFYYHNQYKLFQIVELEMEHSEGKIVTNIYAESSCLELLNSVIRPFKGEFNAIDFLEYVLDGTNWNIGEYSTSLKDKVASVNVSKTTQIWGCIQNYMATFGYEINTRVTYSNGKITNYFLDIYEEGQLGERTYKRFEYSRNVTDIIKKKDLYDFCTAIVLDSTVSGVLDIVIDLADWKKSASSDVIFAKENNNKYNNGGDYIYGVYSGNEDDPNLVVENALAELQRRSVPCFDYECTTVLTYEEYQNTNIGDTVYVIDHTFDPIITLEARIGTLEISFTDRNNCKCNLTNYKEIKGQDINSVSGVKHEIDKYFPITSNGIADGAITNGKIDTTYLKEITSDIVSAGIVVTEELIAKEVNAIDGKFENLDVKYATIENLNVVNANITHINSDMAEIKTLVNGNLTSDNIQSLVLTSDKVTVSDAFIKSAMIDTINADKIIGGSLITNNVSICSNDGAMQINGTTMQFKDKNGNVRMQIGKDATENFTFVLYDADGKGQLINEKGITASAIEDGLIVDSMIGADANINGAKLNINSVIKTINESDGSEVLSSTKVYLDDEEQTLQVAFGQLKTKVDTIEEVTVGGSLGNVIEQVTTNTTNITIMQGEISGLIANTTITKQNGQVVQLKDEFNSTKNTVDSHTTTINSMQTDYNALSGEVEGLITKTSELEQNIDGFKTTVVNSYYNKEETDVMIGGVNATIETIDSRLITAENVMTTEGINSIVKQSFYTKEEVDIYNTTYKYEVEALVQSEIEQTSDSITMSILNSGGLNSLYNSSFKNATFNWHYGFVDYNNQNPSKGSATLSVSNPPSSYNLYHRQNCLQYYIENLKSTNGTTLNVGIESHNLERKLFNNSSGSSTGYQWTFQCLLATANVNSVTVAIAEYNSSDILLTTYNTWNVNVGVETNGSKFTKFHKTFTLKNDNCHHFTVRITMNSWNGNGSWAYLWLTEPMLRLGHFDEDELIYSLNADELYNGIVTIDKDGLTVQQSNYNGYTQMKADGFYLSDGTKNVMSCNADGLTIKGTITGSTIVGSNYKNSDGTFSITNDGTLTVTTNFDTYTDKIIISPREGISSYVSGELYNVIDDGQFSFYCNSYLVGSISRGYNGTVTTPDIPSKTGVSIRGEFQNIVDIGVKVSDGSYDTPFVVCGKDNQTYNYLNKNYSLKQGLNMFNPHILGTIYLQKDSYNFSPCIKSTGSSLMEGIQIEGYSVDLLIKRHKYSSSLVERSGKGLSVVFDAGGSNYSRVYVYGDLDMQGFTISNATMTSSLSAQSVSTYSLLNSGTIEMNTYVPYTFTKDEIRYVEREPQHTMEDDEGKYVCYCEIPIFMAENMENNYHINISKLSFGDYRILEKNPYFFIVESENDGFSFTYEVVAKQIEKANTNNSIIANDSITK